MRYCIIVDSLQKLLKIIQWEVKCGTANIPEKVRKFKKNNKIADILVKIKSFSGENQNRCCTCSCSSVGSYYRYFLL